jgi:acetyltransferase
MTYTIHRYPAELIDVVQLPAGEHLTIRPVLPQDAEIVAAFFRGLSDGSRRNRFFRSLHELPADLLERFTNVDYHGHLALVATVLVDGAELVVGEGRYVVVEGGAAEFAVTVADTWQGRGIGRLLLARLACRAAAEGVTRLFGDVLPTNAAMRRLARNAGMTLHPTGDGLGLMRAEKHLAAPQSALPCVEAAALAPRLAA